ncbi:MAG: twin-arginine translocase TatA/TatE family subunit [Dehalococcoidales bacterium]|nr:twin-arginine translocase TatA/TatE family subunit [Dehalococcoidales bacterium]
MKIGPWEIILILIVVMMVFGVGKIPEMGKQLGRGIRDFKKYSSVANGEESAKTTVKTPAESTSAPQKLESGEAAKVPEEVAKNAANKNEKRD